ncbi:MAG TPA: hypothetical protein VE441_02050 [Mycobacterium sp.]|nr:hypothetical protein [Mycobacterium sp.]
MTDMERLLTEAGEQWRAEQPPAPEPDLTRLRSRRWRRAAPVIASAAAVLLVAGGVLIVRAVTDHKGNPPASGIATLILRNGDTAEATGSVVAETGRPVRFCPYLAQALDGEAAAPSAGVPQQDAACGHLGVTVTGVDLTKLSNRHNSSGIITGYATLRGVYRDGTLRVTAQSVPTFAAPPGLDLPDFLKKTPCAAPPGGWKGRPNNTAIGSYLRQHSDRFYGVGVSYPYLGLSGIWVAVVAVSTGDVAAAQAELRARFGPNICTVRFPYTLAEQKKAWQQLEKLVDDPANGIYMAGGPGNFRPLTATASILTEPLYDKLAKIGLHELSIDVWLRPVR